MVVATKAPLSIRWNLLKKLAIATSVLIIVFLLGYIPSSISSRTTEQHNVQLEDKLKVAEAGSQLAMASYEASRNNYANATQYSSQFFSGLPEIIADSKDPALKNKLQAMLARRDEITSNIGQVDQTVKEKLAQMYAEYFQAMQASKLSLQ